MRTANLVANHQPPAPFFEEKPDHFWPRGLRFQLLAFGIEPMEKVGLQSDAEQSALPCRGAADLLCVII